METFTDTSSHNEWLLSFVKELMHTLYTLTGEGDLERAILIGKIQAFDEKEKESAYTLAAFYRGERSGNLIPPPSLKLMYREIVQQS